jgi:hypothetical protein
MRARSLLLLENTALKCDLSGLGRRNKHDVLQSRYQLGEFHHNIYLTAIGLSPGGSGFKHIYKYFTLCY